MKNKILKLLLVIIISFGISFAFFQIKGINNYKNFLKEYKELETKEYIYLNGQYKTYTDNDLMNLPEIKNDQVDKVLMKEYNSSVKVYLEDVIDILQKKLPRRVQTIKTDEIIKFGLIKDTNEYLYIYDNDTILYYNKGNYYAFKLNSIKSAINKFAELIESFEANPYF